MESDEGAAREIIHHRADDDVGSGAFEQGRAAGHDKQGEDQGGRDYRDDLLDSLLARAGASDMLGDRGAAARAYTAALDDEIGAAVGAFDFGAQRHRREIVSKWMPGYKAKDEGERGAKPRAAALR